VPQTVFTIPRVLSPQVSLEFSDGSSFSYVYFEKVRIAQGKPKSAGRRKNEKENPKGFLAY
jgi:hypothetical protein